MPQTAIFLSILLGIISGPAHLEALQTQTDWTVGILVYDGVYNSEFVAPMDVFDHVTAKGQSRVRVVLLRSVAPGCLPTWTGYRRRVL